MLVGFGVAFFKNFYFFIFIFLVEEVEASAVSVSEVQGVPVNICL